MFGSPHKRFLTASILLLDAFLVLGIIAKNRPQVLSANTINVRPTHFSTVQGHIVILKRVGSPTPSPTLAPTPTPSPKPKPTVAPTPTTSQTETSTAPSNSTSPGSGSYLQQVNNFRATYGLPPVQNDPATCAFAALRAQEISNSFNHDGFSNRVSSHTLPYPSYHYVNENIAENSDPNNVVQSWIDSPTHNENMRQDTPYVCIVSVGMFYAYEGWKP